VISEWSVQLDFDDADGEDADLFARLIEQDLVDPERVEVIHVLERRRIVVEAERLEDLKGVLDYFTPLFRDALDVKQGVDRGRPCQWPGCETWGRLYHNNARQGDYWVPFMLCAERHAEWNTP